VAQATTSNKAEEGGASRLSKVDGVSSHPSKVDGASNSLNKVDGASNRIPTLVTSFEQPRLCMAGSEISVIFGS